MKIGKKFVVGAVVLALLGLGALAGVGVPGGPPGSAVPAALADGCEGGNPPPPALDCSEPTPTPTPGRGG